MSTLANILLVIQILAALGMIGLVLMQHGKGADMGAAFGSGSSGSLFGATGGANFLSRSTAVLATVFFVSTLALAYLSDAKPSMESSSVLERVTTLDSSGAGTYQETSPLVEGDGGGSNLIPIK